MDNQEIPPLQAAAAIGSLCLFFVGLVLAASAEGFLRYVGITMVAVLLLFMAFSDFFDAWAMERYVDNHPETLRNSEVGQQAVVVEAFSPKGPVSEGRVLMTGERWAARSTQRQLFEDQETVTVIGRDGLVLLVERLQEEIGQSR